MNREGSFKASFSVYCMIFLKFSNKSYNMKTLIILSHSFTYLFIWEKWTFVGPLHPFGVFSQEKTPPISRE